MSPHLILLNETHLINEICDQEINISGYKVYRSDSHSKHTGGTCIYIKKTLNSIKIKRTIEKGIWITSIELKLNNLILFVAVVYCSPSVNKNYIVEYFSNWFENECADKSVVICGDFNLDLLKLNGPNKNLYNVINDNGLKQLINEPTRVTKDSATLIDLCITNVKHANALVVSDDQISDHKILNVSISGINIKNSICKKNIKVWQNYSQQNLLNEIKMWTGMWFDIQNDSVNNKMNWLTENLKNSVNKLITIKTVSVKNNFFFDKELEVMRKKKNDLYKIAQFHNDDVKWKEYKVFKNKYKSEIEKKQYETVQKQLNKTKNDSKATWRFLNSLIKNKDEKIEQLKVGDKILYDKVTMANELNKFFVNSINDITDSIPYEKYENNMDLKCNDTFYFKEINEHELLNYIKLMNKKIDCDNISTKILLDAWSEIKYILLNIINDSFKTGTFPETLKQAIVIPIQKVKGTMNMNELRPINNLVCLEKLFESIMVEQMTIYLEKNKIICDEQSGFRNNHSCESSINYVLADWKEAQDRGETIIAVFIDFKRAFETVDIEIFLSIAAMYGFNELALSFMYSFLINRKQRVKLDDAVSDEITIAKGVPQGSKSGPIEFLMYINILKYCLKFCRCKFFADDTLIYITTKNETVGEALLNIDLKNFISTLNKMKLCINTDKTKYLVISNKKKFDKNNVNIIINNSIIKRETEMKYLGIIIDDRLDFKANVNYVCKKMGTKINLICRLKNKLNKEQKIYLYKILIEPYINYCSTVLFLSSNDDIERMQKLQNKFMRNVLKMNKHTNKDVMLKKLNLLSIKQKIYFNTLLSIHKIINNQWPSYLSNKIKYNNEIEYKNKLRNKNDIRINATKTCSQNSLFYKGIKYYNILPKNITNESITKQFKNLLMVYVKDSF